MTLRIYYLFLFLFLSCFSFSQKKETTFISDTLPETKVWLPKAIIQDQGKIWTSPIRMQKKEFIFWGSVLTTTGLAIIYDKDIYNEIKYFQSKHNWVSDVSPVVTFGGDNIFNLSTCAAFYLGGHVFGNKKAVRTGEMAFQSLIHAGIIVKAGKLFFGRQRPSYQMGIDDWHGTSGAVNQFLSNPKTEPVSKYDAFPSGHTIAIWSVATVIAKQYNNIKVVPPICYGFATIVGISRVTEDTHWISDCILGAALGYSIANLTIKTRANNRLTILPNFSQKGTGLSLLYEIK